MPLIDIAIPNYRYGRYLRQCVESVRAQGIDDLRIHIIDNASDDDSVEVARALAAEDARISVNARPANLGPQASFNEGVDWARSKYMMILCSDDFLADGALRRAVAVLEENSNAVFAYGLEALYFEGQALPNLDRTPEQLAWRIQSGLGFIRDLCGTPNKPLALGTVVVRTDAHKKAGHYRPELPYTDDWEMILRLATFGDAAATEAFQGIRREHAANMSREFWKKRLDSLTEREKAYVSFFAHEGRDLAGADEMLALARRRLGDTAYWAGVSHAVRGRPGARELFDFAFTRAPASRFAPPVQHLARIANPIERVQRVIGEAFGGRRPAA